MLKNYIENSKKEMVQSLKDLINIPSQYQNSDNPAKPFGEYANQALEYTLSLAKQMGFKTKNLNGYCGYIEFGEGDKLIGIIGHLDVVPSGDGWNTPPFESTVINNKIYGRGAIDDKGPVIASLYAMKAVKDIYNINSRVRLILGLNEENDWKCIDYYKKHEEWPTIGFSPDAEFPCIYAEKGICTMYLKSSYNETNTPIIISDINCNNNAINVVPKFCSCKLKIDNTKISMSDIENYINSLNSDILYKINHNYIDLISHGIQAHAAHPELGDNSISKLLVFLNKIFNKFNIKNDLLTFFNKHINSEYNGKKLGINCKDESGDLTLNVGDIKLEKNQLKIGLNLRIPVNISLSYIENKISEVCSNFSIEFITKRFQEPLYVPKDSYLVKTLCEIFNKETNSNYSPIAIGGGTYARAFENFVSFGANMPGDTDMCHQANEYIKIDTLITSSIIYAKAILALSNHQ